MTCFPFTKQIFVWLTIGIVWGLAAADWGAAAEQSSTLSGRVINAEGKPLVETPIVLLYVKIAENGTVDTLFDRVLYPFLRQMPAADTPSHLNRRRQALNQKLPHPPFLETETDSAGQFTFTDIVTGPVQLMVLPMENEQAPPPADPHFVKPMPEIQTITFGKMKFHPTLSIFFPLLDTVTFAIKPGVNLQNVEVKMAVPKEIRGRIVFKNGEPLADTTFKINLSLLDVDPDMLPGMGQIDEFGIWYPLNTDADGNFVLPFKAFMNCVLSVNHRGLSTALKPIIIEEGKIPEPVVLMLNGNPEDLAELPPEIPEEHQYLLPNVPGTWIVNPANGHAYKWIACKNREDAQVKAEAEGAHLLTINSETEQIWIEAVFEYGPYWIGLTDMLKEGEWLWETGEPVTYTNWKKPDVIEENSDEPPALLKFFGVKSEEQRQKDEEADYAIIPARWWGAIGQWVAVDEEGRFHGEILMAIIERDGMRSKLLNLPPDMKPNRK